MPNFYIKNRNPITRGAIIHALLKKGYKMMSNWTVARYQQACEVILVRDNHPYVIDLVSEVGLPSVIRDHPVPLLPLKNVKDAPVRLDNNLVGVHFRSIRHNHRRAILEDLVNRGFTPMGLNTLDDLDKHWPFDTHPYVVTFLLGGKVPKVDVVNQDTFEHSYRCTPQKRAEDLGLTILAPPMRPAVVFPKPAKYSLVYQKEDGRVNVYTVSNPIEENVESFTTYAFSHGIRTFKKSGVRGMTLISQN